MKNMEVYLDIYGFTFDPDQAKKIIGFHPDQMQKLGDVPEGKRRPAKENSISFYSKNPENDELDIHIMDIISRLDMIRILDLVSLGAMVTLRVVVRLQEGQYCPNSALFIGSNSLKKLATIGCDLDFDVYAQ